MQDIKPVKISLDKFKRPAPNTPAMYAESGSATAAPSTPAITQPKQKISDVYLSWEAPEYEYNEKSTDWFWMVGVISIALVVVAILMKNILFAIIAMLGGFTFALHGARHPDIVKFAITLRGIKIGSKLFLYDDLDSFWIHYDPPHLKKLIVVSKRAVMPHISISLAEIDPNTAREHLLKFLPEKSHEESLAEILGRLVGF